MGGGLGEMHRDVYGLRIGAHGDWPEVVEALDRDFAWFPEAASDQPEASVRVRRGAPDRMQYGALEAAAITWRSAVFRDGDRTIVDYGRAISVDDGTGRLAIEGVHGWTVWRAAYEFLLGRVDAHVDGLGLARVNGLGLAGRHGGVLVLLPSGGGKTTLTLRALASDGVGLLSEGSPLLDAHGQLHSFPLPLLVRTSSAEHPNLPGPAHLRALAGIDPDPITVEVSAFRDAVPDGPVPLRHVVLGVRTLGGTAALEPLAREVGHGRPTRDGRRVRHPRRRRADHGAAARVDDPRPARRVRARPDRDAGLAPDARPRHGGELGCARPRPLSAGRRSRSQTSVAR